MIAWERETTRLPGANPSLFDQEINRFPTCYMRSEHASPPLPLLFLYLSLCLSVVEGEVLIGQRPGHQTMLPQSRGQGEA